MNKNKNSIDLSEEEVKFSIDNEKKNRSYDLRIKTIEDLEVLLAQMKKKKDFRYKSKSDFVDKATHILLNKEWETSYGEKRNS
ncbi:MAG TPA: hypothetical protein VI911_05780 [Patescibacteria group bacterium]|nr:hypothetical protein [Patescibacteria group bacterium]